MNVYVDPRPYERKWRIGRKPAKLFCNLWYKEFGHFALWYKVISAGRHHNTL